MKKLVAVLASTAFLATACGAAATHGGDSASRNSTITTAGVVRVQSSSAAAADIRNLGSGVDRLNLPGSGMPTSPAGSQPTTGTSVPGSPPTTDRCSSTVGPSGQAAPNGIAGRHRPLPMCAPA